MKNKPQRIKDRKAIEYVLHKRDGCCMIGLGRPGKYGACMGVLDPHHIVNKGAGGDDTKENLVTLCRQHHDLAQNKRISRAELQAILRQYYGYH